MRARVSVVLMTVATCLLATLVGWGLAAVAGVEIEGIGRSLLATVAGAVVLGGLIALGVPRD